MAKGGPLQDVDPIPIPSGISPGPDSAIAATQPVAFVDYQAFGFGIKTGEPIPVPTFGIVPQLIPMASQAPPIQAGL